MKIKNAILFAAFIFMFGYSKGQSNAKWKPLWLSTTNMFKGVEGFYQYVSCNGTDMVYLKFVNHNNYSIKAGWKDLVITNDEQKLYGKIAHDSVTVAPNGEVAGNCAVPNPQLEIKLSDYGINEANFKSLFATNFDFVIIH